jgi:hypothetical protein
MKQDPMKQQHNIFVKIFQFYRDGFQQMTVGRTLWCLVIIKLLIIFLLLRLVLFHPAMEGLTTEQKQQTVASRILKD